MLLSTGIGYSCQWQYIPHCSSTSCVLHTHTPQVTGLRKKLQRADCWMVILTAKVIANSEMDDIRIGAVQPWILLFFSKWDVEGEADRGGVIACVSLSVSCSYSLQVGLPIITGGCGCRGSTTLAQHAQCSLCSFYSCQPTDSLLPIMYSKQCFLLFDVCSLSPWLMLLWIGF